MLMIHIIIYSRTFRVFFPQFHYDVVESSNVASSIWYIKHLLQRLKGSSWLNVGLAFPLTTVSTWHFSGDRAGVGWWCTIEALASSSETGSLWEFSSVEALTFLFRNSSRLLALRRRVGVVGSSFWSQSSLPCGVHREGEVGSYGRREGEGEGLASQCLEKN